jgi:hypothetical protein
VIPLSCSNCLYNGLQFGSLGLSVGFCVQHQVILRRSDETTCGRHLRKDVGSETRERASRNHKKYYPDNAVVFVRTAEPVASDPAIVDSDTTLLESDRTGNAVSAYGTLGPKIATLAQLNEIPGVRAELAMLSLGRTYVRTCIQRNGAWTSGIHLLWWTRKRLSEKPQVELSDIYRQGAATLQRQAELAAWSVVFLRLNFVSDVAESAPRSEPIRGLAGIAEEAAEATETPDLETLVRWLDTEGRVRFDAAFPSKRYAELRTQLHRQPDDE